MIWLYYSNNNAQTGFVSVYTKILINHIQILAITSIYIISLGPVQQTLYAPVKWITMDSTSVISFECFRGEDYSYRDVVLFYLFFPVWPFLTLVCLHLFRRRIRCCCNQGFPYINFTFMLYIWYMMPTLAVVFFEGMSCIEIDNTYKLIKQLDVKCWDSHHY